MKNSMNRRDLFTGSAALAAAALTRPAFAIAAPAGSAIAPIRLGIASYTFRKFDTAHLIDFMHQLKTPWLNLKSVHLPLTPLDTVAAQAAALRAQGFILTAGGNITFPADDDATFRAIFDYFRAAAIPIMVCAPTHAQLPRLEKFAIEYNIKIAIHNHGPEDKNFPSPLDVLAAVKNMDARMGCCIDLGHCMRAGTDVVEAIHEVGPRLFDIHIKDLAEAGVKESQVAVGDGIMPIPAIFKALIAQKYPGCVDLEYEIFPDDPMPGVLKSFAYMRGVLAGLGYREVHGPIA
jgi:hypothetical protein